MRDNVKYVLRPQTQIIYQNVRSNDFRQADGTRVGDKATVAIEKPAATWQL